MADKKKKNLVEQFAQLSKIDQAKLLSNLVVNDSNLLIKPVERKIIKLKQITIEGNEYYKGDNNYIWNSDAKRVGSYKDGKYIFYFKDNYNIDFSKKIKLGEIN
jgi:hypothetical protein